MIDGFLIIIILILAVISIWLFVFSIGTEGRLPLTPVTSPMNNPDDTFDDITGGYKRRNEPASLVEYTGKIRIPKRVYEGDSKNITVDLQLNPIVSNTQKVNNGFPLKIQVPKQGSAGKYLELELLAAGFQIDGDRKQKNLLTREAVHYQWNCYFPNSGIHSLMVIFRTTGSKSTLEIMQLEFTVKVMKLDHLTQRQVWVLATIFGFFSGVLAVAEIAHRLSLW